MNQKCSRIIRKVRKHVLFVHKEQTFEIPKRRCHVQEYDEDVKEKNRGMLSREI